MMATASSPRSRPPPARVAQRYVAAGCHRRGGEGLTSAQRTTMTTIIGTHPTPAAPTSGELRPLGLDEVRIVDGFWARRQAVNSRANDHAHSVLAGT